jgi:hypothetical protein
MPSPKHSRYKLCCQAGIFTGCSVTQSGKRLDQRKVARLRVGANNRRKVEAIHTLTEHASVAILLQEEMSPKNKHAFRLRSYWMFT